MKKGKIFKTLAVMGTCLCAPLLLSGCMKESENNISFRVENGYIQVTEDGTTWKNLVDIDDLKGEAGQNGVGIDGKQVQFQVTETHIQWRYVGDSTWYNLVELADLEGKDASVKSYTITYDYNTTLDILDYIDNYKESQTILSNEWLTDMPKLMEGSSDSFLLGWYIKGTDKRVEEYDFIGGDVILEARWNEESLCYLNCSNFTYNETYDGYNCQVDLTKETVIMPSIYIGSEGIKDVVLVNSNYTSSTSKYNLSHITLSNNLKSIAKNAFNNTKLSTIKLPESLQYINDGAFYRTEIKENVKISENLKYFGVNVFPDDVYSQYDNANYVGTETNPYYVLARGNSTEITSCIINGGTKIIASGAFDSSKIESVVIPDNVKYLGNGAFYNCEQLNSVILGENVETLGSNVFYGCSSLKTINIPKNLNSIGSPTLLGVNIGAAFVNVVFEEINVDKDNAYFEMVSDCLIYKPNNEIIKGLNKEVITTPDNVKSIGSYAFSNNNKLTTLNISNSIEFIGLSSFQGCTSLTILTIPDSVKTLSNWAFADCTALKEVSIGKGLESFQHDDSFATINGCSFLGCNNIESLIVSQSNEHYYSLDNCIIDSKENLALSCKNSILPSNLGYWQYVGNMRFDLWDKNEVSILIGEGKKPNITTNLLNNYPNIKSVYFRNSQLVNDDEFLNCLHIGESLSNEKGVEIIYIKSGITEISANITNNYTKQETSDETGYDMYVKNS